MPQSATDWALLLLPLAIGGGVAGLNSDDVNRWTESAESWIRSRQQRPARGRVSRYLVSPALWILVRFSEWTDDFTHRGLKNGARITATLYVLAVWLMLLYAALVVAIALAIIALLLLVFALATGTRSDDDRPSRRANEDDLEGPPVQPQARAVPPDMLDKIRQAHGAGTYRIDPESGEVQREGTLGGWMGTGTRVNIESGVTQTQTPLGGWRDSEARVEPVSGHVQTQGPLGGWRDTERRIDPDTGVVQTMGPLGGWNDTDERIDPETGRQQSRGALGGWHDK